MDDGIGRALLAETERRQRSQSWVRGLMFALFVALFFEGMTLIRLRDVKAELAACESRR